MLHTCNPRLRWENHLSPKVQNQLKQHSKIPISITKQTIIINNKNSFVIIIWQYFILFDMILRSTY